MEIIPPYLRIYQQILKDLENAIPFLNVPKPKAGSKPKASKLTANGGLKVPKLFHINKKTAGLL